MVARREEMPIARAEGGRVPQRRFAIDSEIRRPITFRTLLEDAPASLDTRLAVPVNPCPSASGVRRGVRRSALCGWRP